MLPSYANKLRAIVPKLKYCYGNELFINVNNCDCVTKCKFERIIPHHKPRPLKYYNDVKCNMTNSYQKIGDCLCIDKCSASQNNLQLFKFI